MEHILLLSWEVSFNIRLLLLLYKESIVENLTKEAEQSIKILGCDK